MPAQQFITQANARCWVWFNGGLNEGAHSRTCWYGAPSVIGGIRIEKADFLPCRVADWRVSFKKPDDPKVGPEMPAEVKWHRLVPTDPR